MKIFIIKFLIRYFFSVPKHIFFYKILMYFKF